MSEDKAPLWKQLIPHAVWGFIKELIIKPLFGGAMITTLAALWQKAKHTPSDWYFLGGIFVVSFLVLIASLYTSRKSNSVKRADIEGIVDGLLADRGLPATVITTELVGAGKAPRTAADIDGEVYRLVTAARSVAWPLVRDLYRLKGREDEAVVDTDILVEMYLVNRDANKTRYVRDIKLSADVSGKRVEFERQDDLWADDFNEVEFEYGIKVNGFGDVERIDKLSEKFPLALSPGQPVEGWIRFMATAINADKIGQGTVTISVVDSVGNEYPITKAVLDRDRRAEVGLRRRS